MSKSIYFLFIYMSSSCLGVDDSSRVPLEWVHPHSFEVLSKDSKGNSDKMQFDQHSESKAEEKSLGTLDSNIRFENEISTRTSPIDSSTLSHQFELHYRRFVNVIIKKLDLTNQKEIDGFVSLALSSSQIQTLLDFSAKTPSSNIYDVDTVLSKLVDSVSTRKSLEDIEERKFMNFLTSISLEDILTHSIIGLLVFLGYLLWKGISLLKFSLLLLFLSSFWHWIHLLKKAFAEKQSIIIQTPGFPSECFPETLSYFQYFVSWHWPSKVCHKYHEALLVNPIFEISPTMALAETLTKFILQPLSYLGESIGVFFGNMLDNQNFLVSIFLCIFVTLIVFLLIIIFSGYVFRSPFLLFSLEPSKTRETYNSSASEVLKLQADVKLLTKTIEDLRDIHMQSLEFIHIQRTQMKSSTTTLALNNTSGVSLTVGKHERDEALLDESPPLKKPRNILEDCIETSPSSSSLGSNVQELNTKDGSSQSNEKEFEWVD